VQQVGGEDGAIAVTDKNEVGDIVVVEDREDLRGELGRIEGVTADTH